MGRRKKAIELVAGKTFGTRVLPEPQELGDGVAVEKVDARALVTVGESDPCWAGGPDPLVSEGCLLRMIPPPGTPRQRVDDLLARIGKLAAAIKVLPSSAAGGTPVLRVSAPDASASAREVVGLMISESTFRDRDALARLARELMDEVGM